MTRAITIDDMGAYEYKFGTPARMQWWEDRAFVGGVGSVETNTGRSLSMDSASDIGVKTSPPSAGITDSSTGSVAEAMRELRESIELHRMSLPVDLLHFYDAAEARVKQLTKDIDEAVELLKDTTTPAEMWIDRKKTFLARLKDNDPCQKKNDASVDTSSSHAMKHQGVNASPSSPQTTEVPTVHAPLSAPSSPSEPSVVTADRERSNGDRYLPEIIRLAHGLLNPTPTEEALLAAYDALAARLKAAEWFVDCYRRSHANSALPCYVSETCYWDHERERQGTVAHIHDNRCATCLDVDAWRGKGKT
jgi:hypothetical protein